MPQPPKTVNSPRGKVVKLATHQRRKVQEELRERQLKKALDELNAVIDPDGSFQRAMDRRRDEFERTVAKLRELIRWATSEAEKERKQK